MTSPNNRMYPGFYLRVRGVRHTLPTPGRCRGKPVPPRAGCSYAGGMGRSVSAVVTVDGALLGAVGPFAVEVPWWSEVEAVVARLRRTLGVPLVVLRLLRVDGGGGAPGRDRALPRAAAARAPRG